jgi:L-fuculose-phosphate aldolase
LGADLKERELRAAIVEAARALSEFGASRMAPGDISARIGKKMLITPSGSGLDTLRAARLALMPVEDEYGAWSGRSAPSAEWRLHLDIMRARPDVKAIVHCRPTYATALSILGKPIPAVHHMVAAFGGSNVRCTDYAPFGSKELAELAVEGLKDRHGLLLGNLGMVVTGKNLNQAMTRARELERLAKMYYLVLAAGRPNILPDHEAKRLVVRLKANGIEEDVSPLGEAKRDRRNASAAAKEQAAARSAKKGP